MGKTSNKTSNKRTFNVNGKVYTLQLKNIEYSDRMSDETACFAADLVVKVGRKTYTWETSNRGCGGPTDIHHYGEGKEEYNILNEYIKTQVDVGLTNLFHSEGYGDPNKLYYYTELADLVDEMLDEFLAVGEIN